MKQHIHNESSKREAYARLEKHAIQLIEKADIPNWNMLTTASSTTISRILHLDLVYRLAKKRTGHIYEFGCHYGASTAILRNLRDLYEPQNKSRGIVTFDTFTGFEKVNPKDGSWNKEGDFGLEIDSYKLLLLDILEAQRAISGTKDRYRHDAIIEGDVSYTLKEFLTKHPNHLIGCAILDMDVYEATKDVLQIIEPHLTKGALLVFDELMHDQYPGEAIALKESCIFPKVRFLSGVSHMPYCGLAEYTG